MAIRNNRFVSSSGSGGSGGSNPFPVGTLLASSTPLSAPQWLPCDGRTYLKSTYPILSPLLQEAPLPLQPLPPSAAVVAFGNTDVAVDETGTYIATVGSASNPVRFYKRDGDTITKLADPVVASVAASRVAMSADGIYCVALLNASPYIGIWKRSGDAWTALTPPTLSKTFATVAISADGGNFVIGQVTEANFYRRNADDTFTLLTGMMSGTSATGLAITPDGGKVYLCGTNNVTRSYIITGTRNAGNTTYNMATLIPQLMPNAVGCALNPSGTMLAVTSNGAPFINVFAIDGDVLTPLKPPFHDAMSGLDHVSWIDDDTFVCVNTAIGNIYYDVKDGAIRLLRKDGYSVSRSTRAAVARAATSSNGTTYLFVAAAAYPYLVVYKDGFSYNASTHFQVPFETQKDERLDTYIRATP